MPENQSDPTAGDTPRSYDVVAERYAQEFGDELAVKPVDRALYALFAELVHELEGGITVGDVGCGPGHITAHLAGLGLDMVGVDVSPGMISVARRRYSDLRFEVGSFAKLPADDAEWAGAVAPYSLIHLDRQGRRAAAFELARAVRGWLMVAFHMSDAENPPSTVRHHSDWWGHEVNLDFHFLDPEEATADLGAAGFTVVSRTDREPWDDIEHPSRRSYLLARRIDD